MKNLINKKYQKKRLINKGGFGKIYEIYNI